MAEPNPNKRKRQTKVCPHCELALSKTYYYEHRKLYYISHPDDIPGTEYGHWLKKSFENQDDQAVAVNDFCDTEVENGEDENTDDGSESSISSSVSTNHSSSTSEEADISTVNMEEETPQEETEIWPDDEVTDETASYSSPAPEPGCEGNDSAIHMKVVRFILALILVWQSVCNIPDRAVIFLLRLLRFIFVSMHYYYKHPFLLKLYELIPLCLATVRRRLHIDREKFEKYVSCPSCHSIYMFSDAYEITSTGRKVSKRCSYREFYRHVTESRRRPCGTLLLKMVRSKNGEDYLLPKRVYCYKSLKESVAELIARKHFLEQCNEWRTRQNDVPSDTLEDVYDGQVWKSFQNGDGSGYLDSEHNLLLTLNVDWFQPHKHCADTVGAIYLVVQNLPRRERYKFENMIMVGIIPGPREPKYTMNSYLDPLVEELLEFWDGIHFDDGSPMGSTYRAALTCLSADIPASRKCGGFVGHGSKKGCTKCLRTFNYMAEHRKADYGGFQVQDGSTNLRNNNDHKVHATQVKNAPNRNQQKQLERQHGARYSELFRLPYYCPITYTVIDPMHNLLLGTAKHVFKVWKKLNVTNDKLCKQIQKRVDAVKMPHDIGRIPGKIESGFSGFTAQQWKIWVCAMSPFALKGIIEDQHYQIWLKFVSACDILCSKVLTLADLEKGEGNLIEFCSMFENKYGKKYCTINMHLHLHLKQCILDFGPVYSFWCFSFERYNGILGSFHTNNKLAEVGVQVMRRFIQGRQLQSLPDSDISTGTSELSLKEEYSEMFSLRSIEIGEESFLLSDKLNHSFQTEVTELDLTESSCIQLLPPERKKCISSHDVDKLKAMFTIMYPGYDILTVLMYCEFVERVQLYGEVIGVACSRSTRSSCAQAKWFLQESELEIAQPTPSAQMRPCKIREIFRCQVKVKVFSQIRLVSHVLARVDWFKPHPQQFYFGYPVQVWSLDYEDPGNAEFIPIQRLAKRCARCEFKVKFPYCRTTGERVNVIIPISGESTFE